ncbi:MAG: SpoIIE family protein phosphatase [Leptospiraceae bacterium]|nr:SpoIIE family protein phosphatase [Leptospiraceae bacterium]
MQLTKLLLHYFSGDVKKLNEYIVSIRTEEKKVKFSPEDIFYYSLSLSLLHNSNFVSDELKKDFLLEIEDNIERLDSLSKDNPVEYNHKSLILKAEVSKLNGNKKETISLFDNAIEDCKANDAILELALAHELVGNLWDSQGKEIYAKVHITEAHSYYSKWGLPLKLQELERKYIYLNKYGLDKSEITYSTTSTGNRLDLDSVLQASRAISGEIELEKLMEKMLVILFESAGAERGFFMYKSKGVWLIQAEGNASTNQIRVLQAKPLDSISADNRDSSLWELSPNIVNYVIRAKAMVLLNDAVNDGMFIHDMYVKSNKPKSILCYPILNQGNLTGVVYLENNLTTNAFTSERVEILRILSSQIAVSVENSLLYENLEEKVDERTRDLNQALVEVRSLLTEVRGLKEQQDADYFLNTLLIEPLGQNNVISPNVTVEFFIRQKKQFVFRKDEYELGGDLNISDTIVLKGRRYVVFLNGDAMGKSIQGAGGAIVLGTSFKSILQRTSGTSLFENTHPERWLKNAFIEMHKTFETFDGTMLVSVVFGLIDEMTGTMYYLNADHPEMVLYRDGVPEFLKNLKQYTKLGTPLQTDSIHISLFSLKPGDVVIMGSDGKDDIILGVDPKEGYDIINPDERLFLKSLIQSNGDLSTIYQTIASNGKFMDDLSLLKIIFQEYPIQDRINLEESLQLLEQHKQAGEYQKIIELGKEVILHYPHLTDYIFQISYAYNFLENYVLAIDFGERVRLREPENIENIVNLVDAYLKNSNKDRAKVILKDSLKLNSQDERLLKLKDELNM